MKPQYKDIFWSSDYITGINSLIDTLERGLVEGKLSQNYFQIQTTSLESEITNLTQFLNSQQKILNSDIQVKTQDTDKFLVSLNHQNVENFRSFRDLSNDQLASLKKSTNEKQQLLSTIQSDVLIVLDDFLDDYKSFIGDSKSELQGHYKAYKTSLHTVESTKSKFYSKSRQLNEYSHQNQENKHDTTHNSKDALPNTSETSNTTSPQVNEVIVVEDEDEDEDEAEVEDEEESEDTAFQFPLIIGSTTFADQKILGSYIEAALSEIPVKRRVIPIPGMNNEYFTSENLTKWIRKNFHNEDTRLKVEKFGQNLINLGLISNYNKIGQNIFVSDNGFYQFTDLAKFVVKFDEESAVKEVLAAPSEKHHHQQQPTSKVKVDVWSDLKNRWGNPVSIDVLREQYSTTRNQYLEAVKNSTRLKETLEVSILTISRKAEIFNSNRVKLIFELHNKIHSILKSNHESAIQQLESQLLKFQLNENNLSLELLQPALNIPGGWYWPKSDVTFTDDVDTTTPNVSIFGVDLVGQYIGSTSDDFKARSRPLFISLAINKLDSVDYSLSYWTDEIDITSATDLKEWILVKSSLPSDLDVEKRFTKLIDDVYENFSPKQVVNFLKLWLLELPDSLLPFTIYDTLVQQYDKEDPQLVIVQTIGTIPRQNLSTLLYLVSHISSKFPDSVSDIQANDSFRVPFIHLLLRPAPNKTHINVYDSVILKPLVVDLLNKDFQELLYAKLNEMEEYHQEKEKRADESINRLKHLRTDTLGSSSLAAPTPVNKSNSETNHSLTPDGLRAFKTKSPLPSPSPTPSTSPKLKPTKTHNRVSSLLSSPVVKRPSDSLSKRNSQIQ